MVFFLNAVRMTCIIIAVAMWSILFALAQQQQPDPAATQRALTVLQQQRNQAMDAHANAEMRVMQLTEEVAKLKMELDEAKKAKPADAAKP